MEMAFLFFEALLSEEFHLCMEAITKDKSYKKGTQTKESQGSTIQYCVQTGTVQQTKPSFSYSA